MSPLSENNVIVLLAGHHQSKGKISCCPPSDRRIIKNLFEYATTTHGEKKQGLPFGVRDGNGFVLSGYLPSISIPIKRFCTHEETYAYVRVQFCAHNHAYAGCGYTRVTHAQEKIYHMY
jgi:hypothetical protein